ncbi:TPA: hypothetical protein L0X89_004679 [Escherichia coli]|nr:hypothetical protein [Escherichia coli]
MIILKLLNNIGDLVFWLAFLTAFWVNPKTFTNLPRYIWWPMFFGLVVSGIARILLWVFK